MKCLLWGDEKEGDGESTFSAKLISWLWEDEDLVMGRAHSRLKVHFCKEKILVEYGRS